MSADSVAYVHPILKTTHVSLHAVFEIQSASSRFADEKLKTDDCCCKIPLATRCVQSAIPAD